MLRQRVTTDIATSGGQFDVMTIGTYEVPIWAKPRAGSSRSRSCRPTTMSTTCSQPVRDGLSYDGKLYALPFYAESSMLFYRKDLFDEAGIKVPEQPTWEQVQGAGPRSCTIPATRSTASACAASPAGARTWRSSPRS